MLDIVKKANSAIKNMEMAMLAIQQIEESDANKVVIFLNNIKQDDLKCMTLKERSKTQKMKKLGRKLW